MIEAATTALVVCAVLATALASWRVLTGPTQADRVVALDIFLAAAVALCVAGSLLTGRTVFIDVGIGLALVGFVGTVGWAQLIGRSPASRADSGAHSRAEAPAASAAAAASPAAPSAGEQA